MVYETIQINDPKKPGDYLWIAKRDYDPKRHTLYGQEPPKATKQEAPAPKQAAKPAPRRKTAKG